MKDYLYWFQGGNTANSTTLTDAAHAVVALTHFVDDPALAFKFPVLAFAMDLLTFHGLFTHHLLICGGEVKVVVVEVVRVW